MDVKQFILGALGIIGIICIPFLIIDECNKKSSVDPTKEVSKVFNSSLDGSVRQVESFLKCCYLRDPNSYQSVTWGPVAKGQTQKGMYHVQHKFRAKNGFGGYTIEFHVFHLDSEGNVTSVD